MSFSLDSQNNIENLIAKNKVKSFSIYIFVLIVVTTFLISLPFIKVDISSQSRGVVRSQIENVPLMSMVSGKIVSLNLENNHNITKGDTLIVLTQDNLKSEQETTQNISKETQNLLNDLKFLLQNTPQNIKTSTIRQEWQSYYTKLTELLSKEEQFSIVYNRNKQLYDKGVIALVDYEKTSYDYTYAKQAVASFQKNQYALWQSRVQELTEKAENLRGTLDKIEVESQNYIITAPISGTIENFSGVQVGSYLLASQAIASISPNHNLIVETMVSPKDIGLIKVGQQVNFQIDAFNYNQWGLAYGKVIDIDQNISMLENQGFFKIRCNLDTTQMELKNSYTAEITKGMTLTSRFIITQRSLYELLFDKVEDWLNPKIISE